VDNRIMHSFVCDGGTTEVYPHRAVVFSSTVGKVEPPAAEGARVAGVTEEGSDRDGKHIDVTMKGTAKCEAASAISYGDRIRAADTDGKVESAIATLTTALAGDNNDLVFTTAAAWMGSRGDLITIEYRDPGGNNASESIVVEGTAIIVNLATDGGGSITSTGDTIKATLAAHTVAAAMVTAADAADNDGSGVVIAMAAARLSGGAGDFATALEAAAADTEIINVEVG